MNFKRKQLGELGVDMLLFLREAFLLATCKLEWVWHLCFVHELCICATLLVYKRLTVLYFWLVLDPVFFSISLQ